MQGCPLNPTTIYKNLKLKKKEEKKRGGVAEELLLSGLLITCPAGGRGQDRNNRIPSYNQA